MRLEPKCANAIEPKKYKIISGMPVFLALISLSQPVWAVDFHGFTKSISDATQSVWNRMTGRPTKEGIEPDTRNIPHIRHRKEMQANQDKGIDSVDSYAEQTNDAMESQVKVLDDPQLGLAAKLLLIRKAKHTIDLTTYILGQDETGYTLLHELKEAVKRGVQVRLMIDSQGSLDLLHGELKNLLEIPEKERGFMRDRFGNLTNVRVGLPEIRTINSTFNPGATVKAIERDIAEGFKRGASVGLLENGDDWLNHRSHDKIVLIDASYGRLGAAIIGGRNLTNQYNGIPVPTKETYNDMDLMILPIDSAGELSPVTKKIESHFERLFYHTGNKQVEPWTGLVPQFARQYDAKTKEHADRILDPKTQFGAKLLKLEKDHFGDLAAGQTDTNGFGTNKVKFWNEVENLKRPNGELDHSNDSIKPNPVSIVSNVREMVHAAKHSIDIVSPYFYLDKDQIQFLADWLKADPNRRIRIITNSLYTADTVTSQALTDQEFGPNWDKIMRANGVRDRGHFLTLGRQNELDLSHDKSNPSGMLHGKVVLIDGEAGEVGSSNGDFRSQYLNSEAAIGLLKGPAAEIIKKKFVERLADGSTEFGTDEFYEIRRRPELQKKLDEQIKAWKAIELSPFLKGSI